MSYKIFGSVSFKVKAEVGHAGIGAGVGLGNKFSSKSSGTVMLENNTNFGVMLQITFKRSNYSFSVPFLLSSDVSLTASLWGVALPSLLGGLVYKLAYEPLKVKYEQDKLKEFEEKYRNLFLRKKTEAEEALILLSECVREKIKHESSVNGLLILEAFYGKLDDPSKTIDVTIPVQFLVSQSQLLLNPHPKYFLLGFYDPCFNEPKRLSVRYKFRGKIHKVEIDDTDSLVAPLRFHLKE